MKIITKTPEQYKQLIAQAIQTKFSLLIIGILVLAVIYAGIYSQKKVFTNKMSEIVAKPPTPPAGLNLEKILGETNIDIRSQLTPGAEPNSMSLKDSGVTLDVGVTSSAKTNKVTDSGKTYTVQEGDSLASIAEKVYGDSNAWPALAEANNLPTPDSITVGMILVIPR